MKIEMSSPTGSIDQKLVWANFTPAESILRIMHKNDQFWCLTAYKRYEILKLATELAQMSRKRTSTIFENYYEIIPLESPRGVLFKLLDISWKFKSGGIFHFDARYWLIDSTFIKATRYETPRPVLTDSSENNSYWHTAAIF